MTGSWIHVWTLTEPTIVYKDVTERLYPLNITREGARALLKELKANGTAGKLPPLSERFGNPTAVDLVQRWDGNTPTAGSPPV